MVATSGSSLIKTEAIRALIENLLPISTVITPNIPEGEILADMKIESKADMETAAKKSETIITVRCCSKEDILSVMQMICSIKTAN